MRAARKQGPDDLQVGIASAGDDSAADSGRIKTVLARPDSEWESTAGSSAFGTCSMDMPLNDVADETHPLINNVFDVQNRRIAIHFPKTMARLEPQQSALSNLSSKVILRLMPPRRQRHSGQYPLNSPRFALISIAISICMYIFFYSA